MFKRKYSSLMLLGALLGAGLVACTDELNLEKDPVINGVQPGILRAEIYFKDYEEGSVQTRFATDTTDRWSIAGGTSSVFTSSDTVGIFARWGNMNLPTKDGRGGPLINVPMYFVGQQYPQDPNKPDGPTVTKYTMENDTVEVYPPGMKTGNGIFMYYPYTPDMGNIENYPNWREYVDAANIQTSSMYWGTGYSNSPSTQFPNLQGRPGQVYPDIPGMELRVKAPDGTTRCREVVQMYTATTAELTKGTISGAVYHAFSELIITRGVGFDKPVRKEGNDFIPDSTIYVVLDRPITHMRVITYANWVHWTTQLFYQENYMFDGQPMDEEEARKWYAWKGTPYPYTKGLPMSERKDAWYVMIPTINSVNSTASWATNTNRLYNSQYSPRPVVSEICLYDNDGYLQHVTSFTLKATDASAATKSPSPYRRWPIEIAMDELGPTVRPVTIENWDEDREDKDITDERTAGIHNNDEFIAFATAYNSYIGSGRTTDDTELWKYGDLIDGVWHFYVGDWDFNGGGTPAYITELQDVIEGDNQFFNVVWSNLRLTAPLFGKITKHGAIKNIDFQSPYLTYTANSDPVGLLAKEITVFSTIENTDEKTFDNCNIYNGTVVANGPAGLLAGTIDFGRIANCTFSGKVVAASTNEDAATRYLFGEKPANNLNITSSNFFNIIFGQR